MKVFHGWPGFGKFQQASFDYEWVPIEKSNTREEVPQMELCHSQVGLQYNFWFVVYLCSVRISDRKKDATNIEDADMQQTTSEISPKIWLTFTV